MVGYIVISIRRQISVNWRFCLFLTFCQRLLSNNFNTCHMVGFFFLKRIRYQLPLKFRICLFCMFTSERGRGVQHWLTDIFFMSIFSSYMSRHNLYFKNIYQRVIISACYHLNFYILYSIKISVKYILIKIWRNKKSSHYP